MRCPACSKLIGDTPFLLNEHRKQPKGECGEPTVVRYVGKEPTPEIIKYEQDRARRISDQVRRGNRNSPMKRIRRTKMR